MKYKNLCHKLQMIDRAWNDYADYIKTTWSADHFWQIIHCEIKPDKLRHRAKQAHMQGSYYGISTLIPKCNEIYSWNKDKIQGQKSLKTIQKCIIYTHPMSNRPIQSIKICIHIHWVTHTSWKLIDSYIGCHITQPIQHIILCCQGPCPT